MVPIEFLRPSAANRPTQTMHPTNRAYPTSKLLIARGRSLRLEEFNQRERVGVGDVGKIRREIELIVFLDHEAETD